MGRAWGGGEGVGRAGGGRWRSGAEGREQEESNKQEEQNKLFPRS